MTTASPTAAHPAQFSSQILAAISPILAEWNLPVHDPFAGPGVRLGAVCDGLHLMFTGTELEPEFIDDLRVDPGDSTMILTYPVYRDNRYTIVTSPSYPNGMSDHFHARDDSDRHTYRQAIANIRGADRELHPNNMGRYSIRAGNKAFHLHMEIASLCIRHWPDRAIVNVSDFIAGGEVVPYVKGWRVLLHRHGYIVDPEIEVKTPRQRKGANGAARVDHETVLVAIR